MFSIMFNNDFKLLYNSRGKQLTSLKEASTVLFHRKENSDVDRILCNLQ